MRGLAPLLLAVAACGGSDVDRTVGASCTLSSQCDERCLTGGKWPGGFCTVSCDSDFDCPEDTRCINAEGGVCAFACDVDPDCAFLDSGYVCKDEDIKGGGGKVPVCRGP